MFQKITLASYILKNYKTMTITIDDTYLLWGSVYAGTSISSLYLLRKSYTKEEGIFPTFVLSILSIIPLINIITLFMLVIITCGESMLNILNNLWAALKYIWNIPKNARLLQTTLHENKQLKQDNAIFQKMLQSGLDYETAKAYIENDDEYFRTKYHKVINLNNK